MGFGFYLFWPAFYTDVTDSYRLGRGGRVRTDLGGLYFNALVVLAVVRGLVADRLARGPADRRHPDPADGPAVDAAAALRRLPRAGRPHRRARPLPAHRPDHDGPAAGALAPAGGDRAQAVGARRRVALGARRRPADGGDPAAHGPRPPAACWRRRGPRCSGRPACWRRFGDGDILGVLARALAVVAVVLPLLGLVLRPRPPGPAVPPPACGGARRTGPSAAASPCSSPSRSSPASAGPGGRPTTATGRCGRARAARCSMRCTAASSGRRCEAGAQGSGTTIWPEDAGPLPTADRPALALVLVPARERQRRRRGPRRGGVRQRAGRPGEAGAPAPTWVFPFDRPLPPGEGDNQALAVNTQDGSVQPTTSRSPWSGRTRTPPSTATRPTPWPAAGTAARSPSPSRWCCWSARSTSSSRRTSPPRSTTPASSASPTRWPPSSSSPCDGPLDADGQRELAAIWAELAEFGEQIDDAAGRAARPARRVRDPDRRRRPGRRDPTPTVDAAEAAPAPPTAADGGPGRPHRRRRPGRPGPPERRRDDADRPGRPGRRPRIRRRPVDAVRVSVGRDHVARSREFRAPRRPPRRPTPSG